MLSSDVAMAIAREHGFADAWTVIEPTTRIHDVLNQAAETDAALLRRLASREGYVFYIDDTGFHFHPENLRPAPSHILGWRTESDVPVTSINVENDVMRRIGKVSVRGRDPLTRTTREASANKDTAPRTTLGEGVAVVDPETGALSMEVRNASEAVRADSTGDAQREANNRFKNAERPTVKLTIETLGEPSLRAKTLVELRGLPPLLSGKYYLTEVRHTVNSQGYVCSLKLVRDALGRRAASALRRQGGDPNRAEKKTDGALTPVLVIDPETGATRREYRRDGRVLGGEDPEARMSNEVSVPDEVLMSGTGELMSVRE
jgi:phage protein D